MSEKNEAFDLDEPIPLRNEAYAKEEGPIHLLQLFNCQYSPENFIFQLESLIQKLLITP